MCLSENCAQFISIPQNNNKKIWCERKLFEPQKAAFGLHFLRTLVASNAFHFECDYKFLGFLWLDFLIPALCAIVLLFKYNRELGFS